MKTHLRDTKTRPHEYSQSPHIASAIIDGNWTVCKIITDKVVTHDHHKVTCKACLKFIEARQNDTRNTRI